MGRPVQKLGGYLIKLHLTIMDVHNLFKPVNKHRPETIKKTMKKHTLQYLPVILFSINDVQHFLKSVYKYWSGIQWKIIKFFRQPVDCICVNCIYNKILNHDWFSACLMSCNQRMIMWGSNNCYYRYLISTFVIGYL